MNTIKQYIIKLVKKAIHWETVITAKRQQRIENKRYISRLISTQQRRVNRLLNGTF